MLLFHEACGSSQLRVRTSGFSWLYSFHPAAAFPARPGAGARFPARRHINRSAGAESQDKSPRLFCVVCDKPPRAYRKPFFRPDRGKKPGKKPGEKPGRDKSPAQAHFRTLPWESPRPGTLCHSDSVKSTCPLGKRTFPGESLRPGTLSDFVLRKSAGRPGLLRCAPPGWAPGGSQSLGVPAADRAPLE